MQHVAIQLTGINAQFAVCVLVILLNTNSEKENETALENDDCIDRDFIRIGVRRDDDVCECWRILPHRHHFGNAKL